MGARVRPELAVDSEDLDFVLLQGVGTEGLPGLVDVHGHEVNAVGRAVCVEDLKERPRPQHGRPR